MNSMAHSAEPKASLTPGCPSLKIEFVSVMRKGRRELSLIERISASIALA